MPYDGSGFSQVKQDLIAARELLVEKGWVPGCGSYASAGPNCIITAISVALGERRLGPRNRAAFNAVSKYLPNYDIAAFNDSQTSIEPVLELLDRAIAECE